MLKKIIFIACLVVNSAFAFDIKAQPVEVIIPFTPGGGVDLAYRHFEKYALTKGIITVPVYKPGADGLIAMRDLAGGSKDGYRISFATTAVLANALQKDPDIQLQPITAIKNPLGVFVVSSKSDIKSFDQLVAILKTSDKINIGSGAPGQTMVWTQLFQQANTPVHQLINYKGGQQVLTDLLGGHIDVAMLPAAIVQQQIKSGNLRILAHTGSSKLYGFDNATPLKQKYTLWGLLDVFVVIAPKLTKEQTDMWTNLLRPYVLDPSIQKEFIEDYNDPVLFGTSIIVEAVNNIQYVNSVKLKN